MAMPAESAKRWTAAEARRLNEENYLESRPSIEILPGPADIELGPDSALSPDLFVFPQSEGRRSRYRSGQITWQPDSAADALTIDLTEYFAYVWDE
jgi:hypothetical protein